MSLTIQLENEMFYILLARFIIEFLQYKIINIYISLKYVMIANENQHNNRMKVLN